MTRNVISALVRGLRGPDERYVTHDKVACPRVAGGDVDADACFSCGFLTERGEGDDGPSWIRCRPVGDALLYRRV